MRSKTTAIIILSTLLLLNGCTSKSASNISGTKEDVSPAASKAIKTENTQPPSNEAKYLAPYTGEEVTKESANSIAFMSIIENSSPARPQSGFTEADIVYEAMAEGGITACLAIYQK